MKTTNKLIFASLLLTCSACAGQFFTPYDQAGRISLQADQKGMQAFADMMTGLVNEGKTPKDKKSSHYQLRERQEETNQMPWRVKMQQRFTQGGSNE